MHFLFVWIETSSLSVWARESTSVFAFPGILAVHTVGMGLVAGINAAINLRILGIAPQVPLTQMKRFFPVMWTGFWLNAASGVVLLIAYPTKALTNPVFFIKRFLVERARAGVDSRPRTGPPIATSRATVTQTTPSASTRALPSPYRPSC